ncbi:hypothetical protein LOK49_LG05G00894 [Camellia lanceoleosa]|uniref:Uncharacterized protein n=1 Tax=Camellia lanceoleosa TaxID=1840588 RepID=A0ACC0HP31_9ERIC|nr:hypothetical protein LOK49_LG05G00894 [Camellia lanceoleosa]
MTKPTRTLPLEAADEEEVVGELFKILLECLEQMSTESRKLFLGKFFSELHKEVPLESFEVKRLRNSHAEEAISDLIQKFHVNFERVRMNSTTARSLRELGEEEILKLERFKVRTINFGGAVTEELG